MEPPHRDRAANNHAFSNERASCKVIIAVIQ